jgi:parvulin-like peptidyl-prolyl isomerase
VSCCERDPEFRGMAKDNLTSRALLQQEARRRFPEVGDAEIAERLAKLIAQSGGEDQFYASIGMPFKDETMVRDNVANGVRLDKTLAQVYAPEPQPADAEIRAAYEKEIDLYLTDEQIRASHISINLSGASSRKDVYKLMRELREKALAGADFDALGAQHNSNKDMSPDLGWFKRGEFMEEFEAIAFSMRIGEISPVFVTHLGFHICKLVDRKPAVPKPFEDVRDLVKMRLLESYRDKRFNEFVEELKKSAKIEDTDPDEDCGCGASH